RLALVSRRPLRSADEVLPASFGRIASSAGGHQTVHERALVLGRYSLRHKCPPFGDWSCAWLGSSSRRGVRSASTFNVPSNIPKIHALDDVAVRVDCLRPEVSGHEVREFDLP